MKIDHNNIVSYKEITRSKIEIEFNNTFEINSLIKGKEQKCLTDLVRFTYKSENDVMYMLIEEHKIFIEFENIAESADAIDIAINRINNLFKSND